MILDNTDGGQETKEEMTIERIERERMVYEQGRTDGQTRKERSKKRSDGDKRKERWTEKEGAIEEIRKER